MGKNSQSQKTRSDNVLKSSISREFSSGGVVFKKVKGERQGVKVLWLVTASNPSKLFPKVYWRLPKGWLDDQDSFNPGPMASGKVKADETTLQKSALREVAEEGGVKAKIIKKIGTTSFVYTHPERGKIFKFVTFYLMEWQMDLPEGFDNETSEILWLTFESALKKLSSSNEKQILKKANDILSSLPL